QRRRSDLGKVPASGLLDGPGDLDPGSLAGGARSAHASHGVPSRRALATNESTALEFLVEPCDRGNVESGALDSRTSRGGTPCPISTSSSVPGRSAAPPPSSSRRRATTS